MNISLIIPIVPTGLFIDLDYPFYQYIVPTGQSQRDWILVVLLVPY
jgi:hypothetical protein